MKHRSAKQCARSITLRTLSLLSCIVMQTLHVHCSTTTTTPANLSISKNLFLHRSFSANTARELLMEGYVTPTDFDGFYSFFSVDGAYQRSFNQGDDYNLGTFPFWSGTNVMTVGTNNGQSNLDAYQFGLGNVTTPGSITLDPIIYQGAADFLLYFGASINDPGVFLKIKAPLGLIGVNPQLTEVPAELPSPAQYPAGALSISNTAVNDPALTMIQAFAGYLTDGQNKNGDFLPMEFGLIDGVQKSGTQFGDIEMTLGYNFMCNEDYIFGLGFRAAGPSSNKPTGEFLLEPIFGRGGSWCVGGYIVGKAKVWENHNNASLTVNLMATILHLMKRTTPRAFDLTANGPGSKYLLVADYNNNTYQGIIQNLINLSTMDANSSFSAEGDVSIDIAYLANGWCGQLGYNFWGRTAEILSIADTFPANRYAILGRQDVGSGGVASTLCQPTATINTSVDALGGAGNANATAIAVPATTPSNRISGNTAFNTTAAEQSGAGTSKVFAKCSYSWLESHFSPHLGLAGEVEFTTSSNNALSQWSIALIGGMYF